MNNPIKTNQLNYKFDENLFSANYDVFCVHTSERYFKNGARIIDAPLLNNNVCSVLFSRGNEFFVLMKRDDENKYLLKETLSKAEGYEYIAFDQITPSSIRKDILLQLMLNSLGSCEHSFLKFNNLTGHLYCYHPTWIDFDTKTGVIKQVPCLEIKLSPELHLKMEIHTFTSVLLRDKMTFQKRKFEEYPRYVFSANNTFRRRLNNEKEQLFIMKQIKNKKTTKVKFLEIHNIEFFDKSKMGVLATVIESFNEKFSKIAHLEFNSIYNYCSLNSKSIAKENEKTVINLLSAKPIKIVDSIDDEDSKVVRKELYDLLSSKYGVKATSGKRISKNCLNIRIIHEDPYYEDDDDPHRVFGDAAVQHITVENFSEQSVSSIIHEILIKDDLVNRKITLFDWTALGFKTSFDFGIEVKKEGQSKYIFMTINPDGSFLISEQTLSLFEQTKYTQCVEIFELAEINGENVIGVIRDSSGNINSIKDTGWFTIPEIYNIKAELLNNNTYLRNKEKKDSLLSSCLDIKLFKNEEFEYYFVGKISENMNCTINAANIRKIEPYENSLLFFDSLLPLMNVVFVRNGQLTIKPFPFKYLAEYAKQISN